MMRAFANKGFLTVVAVACTMWCGQTAMAQGNSLTGLLDEAGFDYIERDGIYKVILEGDERTVTVVCGEETMWEDDNGNPVKVVWLWTTILAVQEGFRHPPALLRRVANINDTMKPGNLSVNENNGNVYYNSAFWLDSATPQIMVDELLLAYFRQPELRKELAPYAEEE